MFLLCVSQRWPALKVNGREWLGHLCPLRWTPLYQASHARSCPCPWSLNISARSAKKFWGSLSRRNVDTVSACTVLNNSPGTWGTPGLLPDWLYIIFFSLPSLSFPNHFFFSTCLEISHPWAVTVQVIMTICLWTVILDPSHCYSCWNEGGRFVAFVCRWLGWWKLSTIGNWAQKQRSGNGIFLEPAWTSVSGKERFLLYNILNTLISVFAPTFILSLLFMVVYFYFF